MLKIFLVDDEIIVRESIRSSIDWDKTNYSLVGEAPDGEMALSMMMDLKPDILVTDIRMPFMDGLALTSIVKRNMPWVRIIILSGHDEFEYAKQAITLGVSAICSNLLALTSCCRHLVKLLKRLMKKNRSSKILSAYSGSLRIVRLSGQKKCWRTCYRSDFNCRCS